MALQHSIEGTPQQLAGMLERLSNTKRYRIVEADGNREQGHESSAIPPEIDTENAAAIALLKQWREQDATDEPDEIRKAEEELAEFKSNMNANREASGEGRVYP